MDTAPTLNVVWYTDYHLRLYFSELEYIYEFKFYSKLYSLDHKYS